MQLSDITVEVRDINLNRIGAIRPEDLDLDASELTNNVGTWSLTLPFEHPMTATLRTPGSGIIVTGPNDVLFSGPVVQPKFDSTPQDPAGTVTINGVTDDIILNDYLCYPQPSNPDPDNQAVANDERTGNCETLMHAYVNANLGPGAHASRKKANLTMGPNLGRGKVVTKKPRFKVVGNILSELATAGGLGFRVVQRGSVLVFETYAVADRTSTIRLSTNNGQLAGQKVSVASPGVTRVIVAGQNEGTERTMVVRDTTASIAAESEWGRRIERFLDQRNTDKISELNEAGDEVLEEEGFTSISVQAVPAEETTMTFGTDWFLGDKVTVVVEDQELTSTVTGMVLKVNEDGFRLGVLLGEAADFNEKASYVTRAKKVEDRVAQIEQNVEVGVQRVQYLATNQNGEFATYLSYPAGMSYMELNTSSGWLVPGTSGAGLVVTHQRGATLTQQTFYRSDGIQFTRRSTATSWTGWRQIIATGGDSSAVTIDGLTVQQDLMVEGDIYQGGHKLPTAMAAGSQTITVTSALAATVAISFPPGRFSAAPHVTVSTSGTSLWVAFASGITTTGFNATVRNIDGATSSGTPGFHWHAIQV